MSSTVVERLLHVKIGKQFVQFETIFITVESIMLLISILVDAADLILVLGNLLYLELLCWFSLLMTLLVHSPNSRPTC